MQENKNENFNQDHLKPENIVLESNEVDLTAIKQIDGYQEIRYKDAIYLGTVISGKRHGKGVMRYGNGRQYEGYWEQDLRDGKGFERYPTGNSYFGQFKYGKAHGKGVYTWKNGEVYDGEWNQGVKQGYGIWKGIKNDSYIGEWSASKAHGYGVHTWPNGDRYEGQWKMCLKHGQGTDTFSNGDTYTGEYVDGKPHGKGEYIWSTGQNYVGDFFKGKKHGKGKWKSNKNMNNNNIYEGDYINDKKHGFGVFTWASGNIYKGDYKDDERNGNGQMLWTDGSMYEGEWQNGIQHGLGRMVFIDGSSKEGYFENNVFKYAITSNDQSIKNNNKIDQKSLQQQAIQMQMRSTKASSDVNADKKMNSNPYQINQLELKQYQQQNMFNTQNNINGGNQNNKFIQKQLFEKQKQIQIQASDSLHLPQLPNKQKNENLAREIATANSNQVKFSVQSSQNKSSADSAQSPFMRRGLPMSVCEDYKQTKSSINQKSLSNNSFVNQQKTQQQQQQTVLSKNGNIVINDYLKIEKNNNKQYIQNVKQLSKQNGKLEGGYVFEGGLIQPKLKTQFNQFERRKTSDTHRNHIRKLDPIEDSSSKINKADFNSAGNHYQKQNFINNQSSPLQGQYLNLYKKNSQDQSLHHYDDKSNQKSILSINEKNEISFSQYQNSQTDAIMKKTFNSENMPNVLKAPYNKPNQKQNKIMPKKISPHDLIYLQENDKNQQIYFDKNKIFHQKIQKYGPQCKTDQMSDSVSYPITDVMSENRRNTLYTKNNEKDMKFNSPEQKIFKNTDNSSIQKFVPQGILKKPQNAIERADSLRNAENCDNNKIYENYNEQNIIKYQIETKNEDVSGISNQQNSPNGLSQISNIPIQLYANNQMDNENGEQPKMEYQNSNEVKKVKIMAFNENEKNFSQNIKKIFVNKNQNSNNQDNKKSQYLFNNSNRFQDDQNEQIQKSDIHSSKISLRKAKQNFSSSRKQIRQIIYK